jgi:opacity protein-like surface antigen
MKKKIKSGTLVALIALLSVTAVAQEPDTVKVIKETKVIRDTVIKKEPQVIHDTIIKENKKPDRPELRRGEFGIRYMPTFSSLALRSSNGDKIQGDATLSHGFGIMLACNFSKNVGLQAEVSYLDISQKYKDQNLNREVKVSYLNIPVMLSINTDKSRMLNLNFVAGPQFGVNVGSSIQTTGDQNSETIHARVGATGTDIGVAYGTGLEIALNRMHTCRLDFGYRGFYGLVDGNVKQTSNSPDTYNVIIRGSRMTQSAYIGLTLCF